MGSALPTNRTMDGMDANALESWVGRVRSVVCGCDDGGKDQKPKQVSETARCPGRLWPNSSSIGRDRSDRDKETEQIDPRPVSPTN